MRDLTHDIWRLACLNLLGLTALAGGMVAAAPVSDASRARLAHGQPTWVIVEFEATEVDRGAQTERVRRNLAVDDGDILMQRRQGYRSVKSVAEGASSGPEFTGLLDYSQLPLSAWRLTSTRALDRLQTLPGVLRVHENSALRPVSVSDLGFIGQPATAATGARGDGTTIAVVDGGLGSNYFNYADFGACTGENTPASTCRVALNRSTYPGQSGMTNHGTNVAAIALGVAPGARLAMFDVFNGGSASFADLLAAMNSAITLKSTYNIVAINLSLGDASTHPTNCSSVFTSAVSNARSAGILTVAAAGNSGAKSGLAEPGCVAGVVSVGAVYDASYGSRSWGAGAAAGGVCTDTTTADLVTCFSQSASYLSLLAPGSFVNAPDASFQHSGTSQAAPHVAGAIAVLRARYPAESLTTTLQRLQTSGVTVVDPANARNTPRLNLLSATQLGTALTLSGTGAGSATAGGNSTYSLTVTNNGPLIGTNVKVAYVLPSGASVGTPLPSGCAATVDTVTCTVSSLLVGSTKTYAIPLHWSVTGAIYAVATVGADQINSAPVSQQAIRFGTAPVAESGDAPLPPWAWVMLAGGLLGSARRAAKVPVQKSDKVGKRLA